MKYPKPNRTDYEEFLIQLFYGSHSDYLIGCIKSSYLDVCRTLRGFGKHPQKDEIYIKVQDYLVKRFKNLKEDNSIVSQDSFDLWHRQTGNKIIRIFSDGCFSIHYGQAQKWINMTFKSVYVCGSKRLPNYESFYDYCHIPIDNIILDMLNKIGIKAIKIAWSKWEYNDYISFQKNIRNRFNKQPLLNIEHNLWLLGKVQL